MSAIMNPDVKRKFDDYPKHAKAVMSELRELVFAVAKDNELGDVEETLKWGEPAYIARKGSTLRMSWKAKSPDCMGLYFNCNSNLVETFRELFVGVFVFQGNRAILLNTSEELPILEIEQCIFMALNYHNIKNLPLLGAR